MSKLIRDCLIIVYICIVNIQRMYKYRKNNE